MDKDNLTITDNLCAVVYYMCACSKKTLCDFDETLDHLMEKLKRYEAIVEAIEEDGNLEEATKSLKEIPELRYL